MKRHYTLAAWLLLTPLLPALAEDLLIVPGLHGRSGGRLVYACRSEPKTLNTLVVSEIASKEVIQRMMADLIHINRATLQTEPALAKSWQVSKDGRTYTLELRRGLRFSDGSPFDADDVVFTFQAYLDERVHSSQRDLLMLEGKPVLVRKLDSHRVVFELARPYAAAERIFDSFYILPRHLLEKSLEQGRLADAWGLRTSPSEIAGMGPYRLKEYVPGQRLVLERNPYYWKADAGGARLPYLAELWYVFAGSEDMQVLRFQSGESDILNRVSASNFEILQKEAGTRGLAMYDAGAGFEYNFLFFNLSDPPAGRPAPLRDVFLMPAFRKAVSQAVDRQAIVRLVYSGFAEPLAGVVPPGNKPWINTALVPAVHSAAAARSTLAAAGFRWAQDGTLLGPGGQRVEFSIVVSASNPERAQTAALIQADLKQIGIKVDVAPLESRSLLDRIQRTREFDACILSLASPDADPNVDINVWLSTGATHLWNPRQKSPATPWESEIDGLMRQQMVTRDYSTRKKIFDRVQQLLAEYLPVIPLVSPHILVGARRELANFQPALLDHNTLWNVEELYWREAGAGAGR